MFKLFFIFVDSVGVGFDVWLFDVLGIIVCVKIFLDVIVIF